MNLRCSFLLALGILHLLAGTALAEISIDPPGGNFDGPVLVTINHQTINGVVKITLGSSNTISMAMPDYNGPFTIDRTSVLTAGYFVNGILQESHSVNFNISGLIWTNSPPYFRRQPVSRDIYEGQSIFLSASPGGGFPMTFQWYKDGEIITSTQATRAFYSKFPASTDDAGAYTLVVSNPYGSITSSPAIINILPQEAPVITRSPISTNLSVGGTLTLDVFAIGGSIYQWYKNDQALGAFGATYQVSQVSLNDAGAYHAVAQNSYGWATSSVAHVVVEAGSPPPLHAGWNERSTGPEERGFGSAVWTGSEMLTWSGGNYHFVEDLSSYNPATDQWTRLEELGEKPSPRWMHSTAWTGQEMLIWGGRADFYQSSVKGDGARYNPQRAEWLALSQLNAPTPRSQAASVISGDEWVIWGGITTGDVNLNTGGRYNYRTDSWRAMSTHGAPSPRCDAHIVWTGNDLIVWGGWDTQRDISFNDGYRYNLLTDAWTPISSLNAPPPGHQGSAIWTGTEMIIWGGRKQPDNTCSNRGAKYNPTNDRWTPMSFAGAPEGRVGQSTVWTGEEMIIWGGSSRGGGHNFNTGGRYNPLTDRWTPLPLEGAPASRGGHNAVWTGEGMLVFAGYETYPTTIMYKTLHLWLPGSNNVPTLQITVPPVDVTATEGNTATLSVIAQGTHPLSFQWFQNGLQLGGATNSILSFSPVGLHNAGSYYVRVSGGGAAINSSTVTLTVVPQVHTNVTDLVSITSNWRYDQSGSDFGTEWKSAAFNDSHWPVGPGLLFRETTTLPAPKNTELNVGQTITYYFRHRFTASGPVPGDLLLRAIIDDGAVFYLNGVEVGRYNLPAGAISYQTLASFAAQEAVFITPITVPGSMLLPGENVLAVEVHQNAITSSDIVFGCSLEGTSTDSTIRILEQPQSVNVVLGQPLSLSVSATSEFPLSYQWYRNNGAISGATSSSYGVNSTTSDDQGTYYVEIRNGHRLLRSADAQVTLLVDDVPPGLLSSGSFFETLLPGTQLNLSAQFTGSQPLEYQWYWNGQAIPEATDSSLHITNVQPDDQGTYMVVASNPFGSATNLGTIVEINTGAVGGSFESVNRNPDAPIYDVDGTNLLSGPRYLIQFFAGRTADSLSAVGPAKPLRTGAAAGFFRSTVQIVPGASGGEQVYLQVRAWDSAAGPSFDEASTNGGSTGQSAVFTVTLGGGGSPPTPPPALAGLQSFSIGPSQPPVIAGSSETQNVQWGQDVHLFVNALGVGLSYQWYYKDQPIQGETASSLLVPSIISAQAGLYYVIISNSAGSIRSQDMELIVDVVRLIELGYHSGAGEGSNVQIPIVLTSHGDVGAMTLVIRYNPDAFSQPVINWGSPLATALTEVNPTRPGEIQAVFVFPGTTVETGMQTLGTLDLFVRSGSNSGSETFQLEVIDVADGFGTPIVGGTAAEGVSVGVIDLNSFTDNNVNGRVDIGDLTLLLRMLAGLDTIRSTDLAHNDLNQNGSLDSGDGLKLLQLVAATPHEGGPIVAPEVPSEQFTVTATRSTGTPGDLLTVQVSLRESQTRLAGTSFTLDYPAEALQLISSTFPRGSGIVPANALGLTTNDHGQLSVAIGSAHAWSSQNGTVATFQFGVRPAAADQYRWPITLNGAEVTVNGYINRLLPGDRGYLIGRPPLPARLTTTRITSGQGTFSLRGDPGVRYTVEFSEDFRTWNPLGQVQNETGVLEISDPGAQNSTRRFYRLRQLD